MNSEGQEAQHRHRLQNVERRNNDEFGLAALGSQRRHSESEEKRRGEVDHDVMQAGALRLGQRLAQDTLGLLVGAQHHIAITDAAALGAGIADVAHAFELEQHWRV